jgi:hypothetical protein
MSHLKFCYRLMHENSGASDSAVLLMRQNDNRIRLVVSFKAFTSCINSSNLFTVYIIFFSKFIQLTIQVMFMQTTVTYRI